jgi:hypothetical protein
VLTVVPGCTARLAVESEPPGGEVIVADEAEGAVTPAKIRLGPGTHEVKVGWATRGEAPAQTVVVETSTGRVVLSCVLPIPFAIIYAIEGWCTSEPESLTFDAPRGRR